MTRPERTGIRDDRLPERHKSYGQNCPVTDLDAIGIEFYSGKPVAIIEWKHKNWRQEYTSDLTLNALRELADGYRRGPIPFLIAVYCNDDWWVQVRPLNDRAKRFFAARNVSDGDYLTEQRFVRALYAMRGLAPNAEEEAIIAGLNDILPEHAA